MRIQICCCWELINDGFVRFDRMSSNHTVTWAECHLTLVNDVFNSTCDSFYRYVKHFYFWKPTICNTQNRYRFITNFQVNLKWSGMPIDPLRIPPSVNHWSNSVFLIVNLGNQRSYGSFGIRLGMRDTDRYTQRHCIYLIQSSSFPFFLTSFLPDPASAIFHSS